MSKLHFLFEVYFILSFIIIIIFFFLLNLNAYLTCRILSDCIPIGGRKRIPYLVVASIFSLFPWLVLGLNAPLMDSKVHLMISLTVQNLGSAMADVVVDAMIAEAVRFER